MAARKQKAAGYEQDPASEKQTGASEKQAKAGEKQAKAGEKQAKAGEKQAKASEKQAKASEKQAGAGEKQAKASGERDPASDEENLTRDGIIYRYLEIYRRCMAENSKAFDARGAAHALEQISKLLGLTVSAKDTDGNEIVLTLSGEADALGQ